jgi:50S ribosomal subunit-associated GTPase HflX
VSFYRRVAEGQAARASVLRWLATPTLAGKSTLFNTMTDAGVLAEDELFATLASSHARWGSSFVMRMWC